MRTQVIGGNEPDRLRANARVGGAENRLVGGSFDAAVSCGQAAFDGL